MLIAALLALAACNKQPAADVSGLSAEDAAQLDNAAEMLDASPDGLSVPADDNAAAEDDVAAGDNAR